MRDEEQVFFHFDSNIDAGSDRLDVRIKIPDGMLLLLREFHLQLQGGERLTAEQLWCVLSGGGKAAAGLSVTADGSGIPPIRPPRLMLNHVTETVVPANGSHVYVVGPSNLYLPALEEVRVFCFRHPATVPATAVISVTGVVQPWQNELDSPPV